MARHLVVMMVMIIMLSGVFVVPGTTGAQSEVSEACDQFQGRQGGTGWSLPAGSEFWAGETITITVAFLVGPPNWSWDELYFELDGVPLATAANPASLTYTFPANTSGQFGYGVTGVVDGFAVIETSCAAGSVPDEGSSTSSIPVAGCDLNMKLTENAAVGTFLTNTQILWGPDAGMSTDLVMEAGKTAWVLGLDDSGEFYKFVWSCAYLWASVSAIGPNMDDVWQGTPLPTTVVE